MNKIFVNNIEYTEGTEGLNDFQLKIQKNQDDGAVEYGTTLEIKAKDDFYDLIYDTFYNNICEGRKLQLDCIVSIDKGDCQFEIPFKLLPAGVSICFDGCADLVLQYVQPDNEAYICLKQQVSYWSDIDRETFEKDKKQGLKVNRDFYNFIRSRSFRILYCQDYSFISYLLLLIYTLTIRTMVNVFQKICNFLENIGLGNDVCEALDRLDFSIKGCDKYYTAVLLKDIFDFNLNKCGLTLQSSILTDPIYSRTALESAIGGEGWNIKSCDDPNFQFSGDNAEIINILQIAKFKLGPIFNSDFRIRGGKFILERKDHFYNPTTLLNIDDQSDELEECPIYSLNTDAIFAYWRMDFSLDGLDAQGNKNINQYNEIIEWNPDGNPNTSGEKRVIVPFAPSKWSNDQGLYESFEQRFLNVQRGPQAVFNGGCNFTHAQIVQDGQLTQPKLIIIDPNVLTCNTCKYASAIKKRIGSVFLDEQGNAMIPYSYNDPLKGPELYKKFHYIDDPNGEGRIMKCESVTWYPVDFCEAVNTILANGLDVGIESNKYGKTIPESINIDFAECSITFDGLFFKCYS